MKFSWVHIFLGHPVCMKFEDKDAGKGNTIATRCWVKLKINFLESSFRICLEVLNNHKFFFLLLVTTNFHWTNLLLHLTSATSRLCVCSFIVLRKWNTNAHSEIFLFDTINCLHFSTSYEIIEFVYSPENITSFENESTCRISR